MAEIQGASCESCKKRKCKCDRNLPFCGQCSSSPLQCKYAENSKRGIPGGYLTSIEQRLNETELALYKALSELRSIKNGVRLEEEISVTPKGRQLPFKKALRMQQWSLYALQTPNELEIWRQAYTSGLQDINRRSPTTPLEELIPLPQPYPRDDLVQTPKILVEEPQSHVQMLSDQQQTIPILQLSPRTISDPDMYTKPTESLYHHSTDVGRQQPNSKFSVDSTTAFPEEQAQSDLQLERSQRLSSLFQDTYY